MFPSTIGRPGNEVAMSIIRFDVRPNFRGEMVMLLSMDSAGLTLFEEKIRSLESSKQAVHFSAGNQEYTLTIGDEHAKIVRNDNSTTWFLTPEKKKEIADKLEAMEAAGQPCHQYVDQLDPDGPLVISLNEYV
jgi:hypothetical protein